jgi:acyl-CoA thioesterase-1
MRICFFGDSFVNGTGDDECLGWVGRLCAAERRKGADITVYNLGIRRDTSADVRRRWRREAEARLVADGSGRLVFSFGLNDSAVDPGFSKPRVCRHDTLANARAIVEEASAWLPVLVLGPLPVTADPGRNDTVAHLSDDLGTICRRVGVPYFSTVPFARANYETWRAEAEAGDGVHPNAECYASLARAIESWDAWRSWFVA